MEKSTYWGNQMEKVLMWMRKTLLYLWKCEMPGKYETEVLKMITLWLVILIVSLKVSRSRWETNLWACMGGSLWIGILMCETLTNCGQHHSTDWVTANLSSPAHLSVSWEWGQWDHPVRSPVYDLPSWAVTLNLEPKQRAPSLSHVSYVFY